MVSCWSAVLATPFWPRGATRVAAPAALACLPASAAASASAPAFADVFAPVAASCPPASSAAEAPGAAVLSGDTPIERRW